MSEWIKRSEQEPPRETWATCAASPSYEVSDSGRVRNRSGQVLHACFTAKGYLRVSLRENGRSKSHYVHRLVAAAFIPGRSDARDAVNHIDFDRTNNSAGNLEWCTPKENARHSQSAGRHLFGEDHGSAVLTNQDVRSIKLMLGNGISQRRIAKRFGVSQNKICSIKLGKTWSHISTFDPGTDERPAVGSIMDDSDDPECLMCGASLCQHAIDAESVLMRQEDEIYKLRTRVAELEEACRKALEAKR